MMLINKYFKHGLVLSVLLGALFAILGVYNTSSIPYFNRFVFWTATMVVGLFGTGLSAPFVFKKLLPDKPLFLQLSAVVLIISVPVTLVLAAFDHNYGTDWSVYIWLVQYRYVLIISAILIFGGYYVLKAQGLIESEKDDVSNPFLKRLPLEFQHAELYAVSSEDHYLKAITSEGSTLILMRLSDAIKELEGMSGVQTHRSWWVAKSAVVKTKRMNGKLMLELKSGETVPVSRTFDKAVKEAFNL